MAKTLIEKIIGQKSGLEVKAGDIAVTDVDLAYMHEGTGPLSIEKMKDIGKETVADPQKVVLFIDHCAPSSRKELSNDHMTLRKFAKKNGIKLYDIGEGICHQIAAERHVKPGDIVIGADSHTCMGGALGAFSTGMGSTDVAVAMALGQTWLRVPETFKVEANGKFPKGVYAKDLILHLIGIIGADGATYKSLEFGGETIANMTMEERFTLSNMAIEAGAKAGLIASDEVTKKYLEEQGRGADWQPLDADDGADYERVIEVDASQLEPTVSIPHTVDNTKTITEVKGTKMDQVFIGSCTNGRISDIKQAWSILKGKKVHPDVRLIVIPASKDVFNEAMEAGYIKDLVDAGAVLFPTSCGPCIGIQGGILGDGEKCVATQNRNFKGRMGNPKGFIYLASPVTAALVALHGEFVDPREVL